MSKKCPRCGNKEVIIDNYEYAYCTVCEMYELAEKFPEQTLFDRITESRRSTRKKCAHGSRESVTGSD